MRKVSDDERRGARINVAFKPKLKRDLYDIAFAKQISVSALLEGILTDYVANHEQLLQEYRTFRDKFSH